MNKCRCFYESPCGLSAVVLTVLSLMQAANASDTRAALMALPAGLDDPSYIFTYPSLAIEQSIVALELGRPGGTDVYGGGLYTTDFGTFGLFVSRDASLMQSRGTVVSNSPDLISTYTQSFFFSRKFLSSLPAGPARPLDVIYARNIGGGALGVRLTWAGDQFKTQTDTQTTEGSADQIDAQVSYSSPVGAGKLDTSLRVGLLGSIENKTKAGGNEVNDTYTRGTSLRVDSRYVQKFNSTQEFYLKSGFWMESPEIENEAANTTQDRDISETSFDVQSGIIARPRSGTSVAAGAAFFYAGSKGPFALGVPAAPAGSTILGVLNQGNETLTLQFNAGTAEKTAYGLLGHVGLETEVTESWLLLAGLTYPLAGTIKVKDEVTAGNPTYELRLADVPDATLWAFGGAYKQGGFRLDVGVNAKGFLHNGPQFITGNQTAAPLFLISVAYDLGFTSSSVASL